VPLFLRNCKIPARSKTFNYPTVMGDQGKEKTYRVYTLSFLFDVTVRVYSRCVGVGVYPLTQSLQTPRFLSDPPATLQADPLIRGVRPTSHPSSPSTSLSPCHSPVPRVRVDLRGNFWDKILSRYHADSWRLSPPGTPSRASVPRSARPLPPRQTPHPTPHAPGKLLIRKGSHKMQYPTTTSPAH
jgi:hypothetical protein